ncbi:LacI family DNA-binding transcriptional regulator [Streptomyces sp. M3]|uniref:LacI family DNA-binding transcriptional regulator n=1 Tax=Streptomyces sp. M3 TaxID=295102 RepID=UPI001F5079CC|nr:LacI family DNA-binding transcriptional regulator [Streptomyces sp. M3]
MARKPTIDDVAQRAGVSRSSVSFALNDRPGIARETKERILAVAAELGWTPSRPARALSLGKAGAFGLVLAREPDLIGADLFFPAFIAGVEWPWGAGDGLMVHLTTPEREQSVYERLSATAGWTGCSSPTCATTTPAPP